MRRLFSLAALLSGSAVIYISLFILVEGWRVLPRLAGGYWNPDGGFYGIGSMVAGTAAVTLGALLLAVPAGVGTAIFLTEVASPKMAGYVRPLLQVLAGVPSVVWGFWGLAVLVPAIRAYLGGPGFSVLAGSLILALMVLPTVAAVAEDALRAVPVTLREGALALGASRAEAVWRVVLPAARSGVATGVVLAMGRAIGETMAVIMVTGNVAAVPRSPLDPARTLTGTIAMEMAYAAGEHREALFATGSVLLGLVLVLNGLARRVGR